MKITGFSMDYKIYIENLSEEEKEIKIIRMMVMIFHMLYALKYFSH